MTSQAMRQLIEAVRQTLAQSFGIDNTEIRYGDELYIAKCGYWFRKVRRAPKSVQIDGVEFERGRDQVANITKHILSTLKDKLKEVAARKEHAARVQQAEKIAALLQGTDLKVEADKEAGRFLLTFRHPDQSTILAAADNLQDSGFARRTSERAPEADEEAFTSSHMLRLFNMLSDESKLEFLRSCNVLTWIGKMNKIDEELDAEVLADAMAEVTEDNQ